MAEFTLPLDIKTLKLIGQRIDNKGNITFTVESNCTSSTCHKCGQLATKRYGYSSIKTIEHTSILDKRVFLEIKPVRYYCEHCNDGTTTTEKYDWVAEGGKTTQALEDYIMRNLIHSTIQDVSKKTGISYSTISTSVSNRIGDEVDWSKYSDLQTIGIDEISNRKGFNDYLAVVSVKDKHGDLSVIAVLDSRKKDDIKTFLESIPNNLKKTVKSVCTDMYDGFVNDAVEVFGKRVLVVDRYHVAKLYRKPLDNLRINEMKRLKNELPDEEYKKLEGMMWIIRKQYECLSEADKDKLALLYYYSPALKKAHQCALRLTQIFNTHCKRKTAVDKINNWIKMTEKSDVNYFNSFIKTLQKYKPFILNYFKGRKNSGFVEGLNNKIKVAKRRCYGLLKTESFFQRLFLDLKGYELFV